MQWTDGTHAGFTTGTPWREVNSNYLQYNVADEEQDSGSLLEWYKRLIQIRNGSSALRRGTHNPLAVSEPSVLAFTRRDSLQNVLCMANTSHYAYGDLTLVGSATSLEPGDHTLINLLEPGDTLDITVTPAHEITGLSLGEYEVGIYQIVTGAGADPGDDDSPATGLRLEQSFPNPFTPSTTIRYSLPSPSHVRLSVYDVAGREVAVIQDGPRDAGRNEVPWDGANDDGSLLAAGVYFLRLDAAGESRTSKLAIVR
jgi:hypothetical protein